MRILTNELKYAKLLRRSGFNPGQAESIISIISEMEIHNIYSKSEIDIMLSEAVERVFSKQDEKLREQQREFDEKLAINQNESREFRKDFHEKLAINRDESREFRKDFHEKLAINRDESREFRKDFHEEIKSSRRWLIGTVITVGMGLAAYLSAIINISH